MKAEPGNVGCVQTTYKRPPSVAMTVMAIQSRRETPKIQVCWILVPCADAGWKQSLCLSQALAEGGCNEAPCASASSAELDCFLLKEAL